MPLLAVHDVVSGYGRTDVLHGVSISVEQDEIVTIIGPNGAGKSTLFKTIMGYLIPRSGKIFFSENSSRSMQRSLLLALRDLRLHCVFMTVMVRSPPTTIRAFFRVPFVQLMIPPYLDHSKTKKRDEVLSTHPHKDL